MICDALNNFQPPYKNGNTTHRFCLKHMGVYIIREAESHKITYVGMSTSCAYDALYRHFQRWNDPIQYRVVYANRDQYEVTVQLCTTKKETETLEKELISLLNPTDNRERYHWYWNKRKKAIKHETITVEGFEPSTLECPY